MTPSDQVLSIKSGSAWVAFSNATLDVPFGTVDAGTAVTRELEFWNRGKTAVTVEVAALPGSPFDVQRGPFEIPSGAKAAAVISFHPTAVGSFGSELSFAAADAHATVRLTAKAVASTPKPKVCVFNFERKDFDFGLVDVGKTRLLTLKVTNTGDDDCPLDFQSNVGPFSILDLEPGTRFASFDHRETRVEFRPVEYGKTFQEAVPLSTADGISIAGLTLKGLSPPRCPVFPNDGTCPTTAADAIYLNTKTDLFRLEPDGGLQHIGPFTVIGESLGAMTDIAVSPSGDLVGLAGVLFAVNPLTAECRQVLSPEGGYVGLTFMPDGRMVAAGTGLHWIEVDAGIAYPVPIAGTTQLITAGDVTALSNTELLWTVTGDTLVRVLPDTGIVTVVGPINYADVYGLVFCNSNVSGFTAGGLKLEINPANAAVYATTSLPGSWSGAGCRPQ